MNKDVAFVKKLTNVNDNLVFQNYTWCNDYLCLWRGWPWCRTQKQFWLKNSTLLNSCPKLPHPSTNWISRTTVVIMLWRTLKHLTMSWPLKFLKCALILDVTPICYLLQYYISIVWCLHHGSSLPYLHDPTLHFIINPCARMFGILGKN